MEYTKSKYLNVFLSILKVGDVTGQECMKKCKNLRDAFVRELRKVKKRKSGESGPCYTSKWPNFELMMFLSDTVKHRQ